MRCFHLADLHLGKIVNGFSQLDDQRYILDQIIEMIDAYSPDLVMISGDIYDRSIPPETAITLFDAFLQSVEQKGCSVLFISGNHDSGERLSFGTHFMEGNNIYCCGTFDGTLKRVRLNDEFGSIDFDLLPFIKPYMICRYFPDEEIASHAEAVSLALSSLELAPDARHVLLAHQFVLPISGDPELSDSEQMQIGGSDAMPVALFDRYDYVALGHLHKAQAMGRQSVRYAGSPLKYSFSEAGETNGKEWHKSVTMVDIGPSGTDPVITLIPLSPQHDMRKIRGNYADITSDSFLALQKADDYLQIVLTDEVEVFDALTRLREHCYPNIMLLQYDNESSRIRNERRHSESSGAIEERNPLELFEDFYEEMNGVALSESQKGLLIPCFDDIMAKQGGHES